MRRLWTIICGGGALVGLVWFAACAVHTPDATAQKPESKRKNKPVENDMHEFMGHLFQPPYERLRQSLAIKPSGKAAWKNIASDSLILAEGGNLLLARSPDEQDDSWVSNATGIRTFGTFVYRSSREKDYTTVLFNYRHMVDQCNDCHREFADGVPHLDP